MKAQSFVLLVVGFLGVASFASAGLISGASSLPVSNCVNDIGDSGFTCNFYETKGGVASEVSDVVSFPTGQSVSPGYVVLLDSPGATGADPTQWSDILQFIDNGSNQATSAQLLSIGCACFPSSAVVNSAPHLFMPENQTGVGNDFIDSTPFVAGFNTFNIFSASPVASPGPGTGLGAVPEPASLALMGFALILLFAFARRSQVA